MCQETGLNGMVVPRAHPTSEGSVLSVPARETGTFCLPSSKIIQRPQAFELSWLRRLTSRIEAYEPTKMYERTSPRNKSVQTQGRFSSPLPQRARGVREKCWTKPITFSPSSRRSGKSKRRCESETFTADTVLIH